MNRIANSSPAVLNDVRHRKLLRDGALTLSVWIGAMFIISISSVQGNSSLKGLRQVQPFKTVINWLDPPPVPGGCILVPGTLGN